MAQNRLTAVGRVAAMRSQTFWNSAEHRCEVGELHVAVAAELPQDLAAGAARWRGRLRVGDDGDARELAMPLGKGLEHGHPFGAHAEAVGGVLDVAARNDGAIDRLE